MNSRIESFIEINLILIIFASIVLQGAVADVYWYPVGIWVMVVLSISIIGGRRGSGLIQGLSGLWYFILAWLAIMVLSSILSSHRWMSALAMERLVTTLIFFYLVLRHFRNRNRERVLLWSLLGISVILSLAGVLLYLTQTPLFFPFPENMKFVRATFINPNSFAGLVNISLFLGFGLIAGTRRGEELLSEYRARQALLAFAVFILLIALGFSLSRGGWIAFVIAGIGLLIRLSLPSRRRRYKNYAVVFSVILLLGICLTLFLERSAIISEAKTLDEYLVDPQSGLTMDKRARVWRSSLRMIRENPFFGTGPGTYWIEFPRYRIPLVHRGIRHAHNETLELAAETGLISAAAFLALLVKALSVWRKRYKDEMDSFERRVSIGVVFGAFAFLIQDQFTFHFHIPGLAFYFLALAAFLVRPREG